MVRDPAIKQQIADWYRDNLREGGRSRDPDRSAAGISGASALVVVCMERRGKESLARGASIYPAVQNMLLAARALGLGTTMTGFHTNFEPGIKGLIGIPDGVDIATIIPMGYPGEGQHFGGSRRKPITEVTFYDRWGDASPPTTA